jgi:HAD superfamily hydrolase (TIGR01509 family)
MLKAVIFDLDGTLTDSDQVHYEVYKAFLADKGIIIDRQRYREKVSGRQNAAILADLLPRLPGAAVEDFANQKEATFREMAKGKLLPMPGLMDLLEQIERIGLKAAVVTNAPAPNAAFMLSELGLSQRFEPVIVGDDLPRGKPDPLPYQTALERLGIEAHEAIAFEDSHPGIQAAVAAGIKTLGITTTHTAEELLAEGAVRAIANFTDPYIQTLLA